MEADLNLAISAGMKLALRYRVVTDNDLLDCLPEDVSPPSQSRVRPADE